MMLTNVLTMLAVPLALALVLPAEVVVLGDLVNNITVIHITINNNYSDMYKP